MTGSAATSQEDPVIGDAVSKSCQARSAEPGKWTVTIEGGLTRALASVASRTILASATATGIGVVAPAAAIGEFAACIFFIHDQGGNAFSFRAGGDIAVGRERQKILIDVIVKSTVIGRSGIIHQSPADKALPADIDICVQEDGVRRRYGDDAPFTGDRIPGASRDRSRYCYRLVGGNSDHLHLSCRVIRV